MSSRARSRASFQCASTLKNITPWQSYQIPHPPTPQKKKKNVPEIQMHLIKMRQHLSEIMNTIQSHILVCYNSCLLLGITWYCQEWVCAPPWTGGAAGGCGAPFYYFLEGREEGRMEETDLQAPAQCVHHPSNRHVKVRQAGKVIQQTCLLGGA